MGKELEQLIKEMKAAPVVPLPLDPSILHYWKPRTPIAKIATPPVLVSGQKEVGAASPVAPVEPAA